MTRTAISARFAMRTFRTSCLLRLLPASLVAAKIMRRHCLGGVTFLVGLVNLVYYASLHVRHAHDDPRPGPLDAAGPRLRRAPGVGELAGRGVGQRRPRLDLPRATQVGRGGTA